MFKSRRSRITGGLVVAIIIVLAFVSALALTGPSVGNVMSSTALSLGRAQGGGQGGDSDYYANNKNGFGTINNPAPNQPASDGTLKDTRYDYRAAAADQQAQQNRIILKNATLNIVVEDPSKTLADIGSMAKEMGGWVVNSGTNRIRTAAGEDVASGTIVVRVPADKLDSALSRIKSQAGTINSENITGEDVTQQYVDISSRLKNLEAAETQLREIVAKAEKTDDVLAAFNQLTQVRGDIESAKGQIQYFEQSAAFSSITVYATPKAIETPIQIAGWSPGRTAERALAGLVNILRFIADAAITLVIVLIPLGLLIGIPVWLIYRRIRQRRTASL